MIDSNVIISAIYNKNSKPADVLSHVMDSLISGDKHFLSLEIEKLKIITPAQYLDMFG